MSRRYKHFCGSGWGWTIALAAILVLGGAHWTLPLTRFLAELIACGMLVAALWRWPRDAGGLCAPDWIALALLGLFAIQLVPLPPEVWTALPGRALAARADRLVFGEAGWRPFSLDPEASWRALLMLLPAGATYLAVRLGDAPRRTALLRGAVIAGAIGLALGGTQAILAGQTWLQIYPRSDYPLPVGFFTNRNHQATFLACMVPIFAAWLVSRPNMAAPARLIWTIAAAGLLAAGGILGTASRTGAVLLPLALVGTWLAMRQVEHRKPTGMARQLAMLAGGLMLFGLAVYLLGGDGLSRPLERGAVGQDQRFVFWPIAVDAATAFWPVGSGLGTFLTGYEMREPLEAVGPLYINHAHNDFLEILLEAGVPGLVLALVASWELFLLGRAAWRNADGASPSDATARLAAVALALPILHSLVDYPLRTVTISALVALCTGILVRTTQSPFPTKVEHPAKPA